MADSFFRLKELLIQNYLYNKTKIIRLWSFPTESVSFSNKWVKYNNNFSKKAIRRSKHQYLLVVKGAERGSGNRKL